MPTFGPAQDILSASSQRKEPRRVGLSHIGITPVSPRVLLNRRAPDFTLPDFSGRPVSLSGYLGRTNVLLVCNRGFT